MFYSGPTANATISALRNANGNMSIEDLRNYSVASRTPFEISYRDFKIVSCGAPAGGTVVLSAMKTIEGYGSIGEEATMNLSTHRLDDANRFAYGAVSVIYIYSAQKS